MRWYKISTNDGTADGYTYVGASEFSLEELVQQVQDNVMIKLDDLLYKDEGKVYKWERWDASLIPTVYIHSRTVCSIMELKDDPLVSANNSD